MVSRDIVFRPPYGSRAPHNIVHVLSVLRSVFDVIDYPKMGAEAIEFGQQRNSAQGPSTSAETSTTTSRGGFM